MTREEAIKAMSEGKKVRHRYFGPDEWVTPMVYMYLRTLHYSGWIDRSHIGVKDGN